MKKRVAKLAEGTLPRYALAFLAFLLIGKGALTMLRRRLHYQNFFGGPVFAPFCIFIGLLALVGVFTLRKKDK